MAVPFVQWQDGVTEEKRLQLAAGKVMGRWKNLVLAVPFATWLDQTAEGTRLRSCAQKVVRRWFHQCMSHAWAAWAAMVADHLRLQEVGKRIIKRWSNQKLSSCFQHWLTQAMTHKSMKTIAKKVIYRWMRSSLASTLLLWMEVIDRKRAAENEDLVSVRVAALEEKHRSDLKELREEILKMEKASISAAFGMGNGSSSKRQQELAASIASFALGMWQRQAARSVKSKLQVNSIFDSRLYLHAYITVHNLCVVGQEIDWIGQMPDLAVVCIIPTYYVFPS